MKLKVAIGSGDPLSRGAALAWCDAWKRWREDAAVWYLLISFLRIYEEFLWFSTCFQLAHCDFQADACFFGKWMDLVKSPVDWGFPGKFLWWGWTVTGLTKFLVGRFWLIFWSFWLICLRLGFPLGPKSHCAKKCLNRSTPKKLDFDLSKVIPSAWVPRPLPLKA